MDHLLSKQNIEWRQRAREVARKVILPNAWKYDRLQEYPWEIKNALAEAELMSVWIPKEYGGSGGGVLLKRVAGHVHGFGISEHSF